MKRLTAIGITLLVACGGSSKKPTTQPETTGGSTEGGAGSATDAVASKPEEPPVPDTGGYKVIAAANVAFSAMDPSNPGGPEVSVAYGDLQKGGAFFLKLAPGSKSGLHTHTADYQAVLVSGAHKHWLPGEEKKAKVLAPGSYWFQPGGQPHGDECTGKEPCVLFIVQSGAFDFAPAPKAAALKDKGKYMLVERKSAKFAPVDPTQPDGLKAAFLSGDPKTGPLAMLLEVPAGGQAPIHSHTSNYHALVLDGAPTHWLAHEKSEGEPLATGSYWFQPGGHDHGDHCTSATPCHAFVYFENAMDMKPAKQ